LRTVMAKQFKRRVGEGGRQGGGDGATSDNRSLNISKLGAGIQEGEKNCKRRKTPSRKVGGGGVFEFQKLTRRAKKKYKKGVNRARIGGLKSLEKSTV